MFVELRLPDLVELVQFLREKDRPAVGTAGKRQPSVRQLCTNLGAHCRVSLWRKRGSRCVVVWRLARVWGPASLPALFEEKRLLVNRGEVIEEQIAEGGNMAEVGGCQD